MPAVQQTGLFLLPARHAMQQVVILRHIRQRAYRERPLLPFKIFQIGVPGQRLPFVLDIGVENLAAQPVEFKLLSQ